jgi:hypothetical protein
LAAKIGISVNIQRCNKNIFLAKRMKVRSCQ